MDKRSPISATAVLSFYLSTRECICRKVFASSASVSCGTKHRRQLLCLSCSYGLMALSRITFRQTEWEWGRGGEFFVPELGPPHFQFASYACEFTTSLRLTLMCILIKKCTKFGSLILRNIIKILATRCHILRLKCTKFDFSWGSAPDPAGGAYSAPPDPLAGFKGAYF